MDYIIPSRTLDVSMKKNLTSYIWPYIFFNTHVSHVFFLGQPVLLLVQHKCLNGFPPFSPTVRPYGGVLLCHQSALSPQHFPWDFGFPDCDWLDRRRRRKNVGLSSQNIFKKLWNLWVFFPDVDGEMWESDIHHDCGQAQKL